MTTSLARFPLRGLLHQVALASCLVLAGFSAARAQVIADDFHACAVDPAWTFVDPLGDGGSASITGGYTDDAHLSLYVPGGAEHEAWAGVVNAPHVSRPLADADFTTTVKFASELPSGWSQEGLYIREGASQWLRLEFYRDGAGYFHVAAIGSPTTVFYDTFLVPNTPSPFYMRVTRTGDSWLVEWSNDGSVWTAAGPAFTFALHPDRLAIYAGNRGATPPAHTVQVDWIGTDGAGDDLARNTLAATVSGGGLVTRGPDLANYACGQTVTLTAVEEPGWTFAGWSGSVTGTQNPVTVPMNGPGAVLATFVPVPFDTLVTAVSGGGSISLSPPGGIYNRGTVVTVTAIDGPGWAFDAFTGDLSGSVNPQTITMNGNRAVTAAFTPIAQYTVTANVAPASSGSVTLNPAGGTYNAGTRVVVRAIPAQGWVFTGWSGDLAGVSTPDSLVVDADKAVTATFTALPLRVLSTTASGSGTIVRTPDQASYLDGTKVVLAALPDAGWRFTGWSGDLAGTATPDSLVMSADHAVAATFEVIPPVIASDDFNRCALGAAWTVVDPFADGGTAQMTGGYTNDAGVAISVPGGFEHEIWAGHIGATHILQPSPDVDFTIEAKFDADLPVNFAQEGIVIKESDARWVRAEIFRDDTNRLRVAVDRGPNILTHDVYLPEGLTAPMWMRVTRTGDTWVQSWSSDGVNWEVAGGPFTYDMTVTATGLFAGNRGSAPPAHTVVVDYIRNTAGAPVGEDADRAPLSVTVDGTGVVNRTLDLPSYGCGQVETLTAVGQPGWAFSSWSGAVTGTQNPVTVPMNGPGAVLATFVPVPVDTLVTAVSGGGSISLSPPGGIYNRGTVVTVTAVDGPGWAFDAFTGDLSGSVNPQTITMNGNRAVTAAFTPIAQYTVTANVAPASSGSVTLNPAGGTYNAGTRVVVRAIPAQGWVFTGWSGDLAGVSSPDSLVVDADKAVTATFTALPLRVLSTTVSGSGTIVRTPGQASYLDGTKVVLAALPDAGWRFTGWSGDLAGTATPDSLVMSADHAVAATFEIIPPVIASDDFNRCDLGAAWTVVDPFADGGTAQMTGGYTNDAGVAISVPGGFEHEIWAGQIGATHILQPSPDVDFTIEAKFDADLPGNFAQEGIVIKESEARWVRAEIFRDDFNRLRVAVDRGPDILTHDVYLPEGLTAPMWMRVTRTGDTWVQSWSSDGVNWNVAGGPFTYDMTVTAAGLFAGNRGSAPPAHTVVVDYIRNTAGAPVGEDADRAPLSVTVDGTGVVNRTLDLPSYGCGQVETLTAVGQPGWAFSSWSGAVTGTQNPVTVTMSGPAAVVAHFTALPQYALDASTASGLGSVQLSPAGGLYYEGTRVAVTAVPDFGWSFAGWGGDLGGTANPDTLVMTGARSVTATFVALPTPNFVSVVAPVGGSLSTVTSCLDSIAVRLDRLESNPIHSFSLGLKLTNVALCSGALSVREGGYLGAHGPVSFVVTQTSDSTLTVDGTLVGGPCGAGEPAGVLAWLDVSALITDGTGTIAVTSVQLRDCADQSRIVEATGPGTVPIDHTPPAPAAGLTATTLMAGNAPGAVTAINVAWAALPALDIHSIEVWRKGFGAQPEYSDGGGAVPAIPAAGTDPASAGWQLAGVLGGTAAGLLDHPSTRDYWYYHVRTLDAAGNRAVTPALAVALDYLLADVAGGIGNAGDDVVGAADVATFSGAYGSLDGQASYLGACDVGPTADASPFSLPTTDNRIDFEDLMILSLSHGLDAVGAAVPTALSPAPAGANALIMIPGALPAVGSTFEVTIVMAGDGTVQGLSLPLTWDSDVVAPVSVAPGALLPGQGGLSLVFMPQPGLVDVALLGLRERGISGAGALAVVTFEVVGTGQPRFGFGTVTARSRENTAVAVTINGVSDAPDLPATPVMTVLHQNKPNPFNPRTTVSFALARPGQVRLMVYGVDGRLARVLADGSLPAGNHAYTWDGTDEGGRRLASGVYLVRLVTPDGVRDVRMTMLK